MKYKNLICYYIKDRFLVPYHILVPSDHPGASSPFVEGLAWAKCWENRSAAARMASSAPGVTACSGKPNQTLPSHKQIVELILQDLNISRNCGLVDS